MKHVFQCYFSVLKRVPNVALLEPVLEGLSKFAHLLGVEFFEDIIYTMENLVENKVSWTYREWLRLFSFLNSYSESSNVGPIVLHQHGVCDTFRRWPVAKCRSVAVLSFRLSSAQPTPLWEETRWVALGTGALFLISRVRSVRFSHINNLSGDFRLDYVTQRNRVRPSTKHGQRCRYSARISLTPQLA